MQYFAALAANNCQPPLTNYSVPSRQSTRTQLRPVPEVITILGKLQIIPNISHSNASGATATCNSRSNPPTPCNVYVLNSLNLKTYDEPTDTATYCGALTYRPNILNPASEGVGAPGTINIPIPREFTNYPITDNPAAYFPVSDVLRTVTFAVSARASSNSSFAEDSRPFYSIYARVDRFFFNAADMTANERTRFSNAQTGDAYLHLIADIAMPFEGMCDPGELALLDSALNNQMIATLLDPSILRIRNAREDDTRSARVIPTTISQDRDNHSVRGTGSSAQEEI